MSKLRDIIKNTAKLELAKKTAKKKGWYNPDKLSVKEQYKARRASLTADVVQARAGDKKVSPSGKKLLKNNKNLSDKELADIIFKEELGSKRGK